MLSFSEMPDEIVKGDDGKGDMQGGKGGKGGKGKGKGKGGKGKGGKG